MKTRGPVYSKSFNFALSVITLYKDLTADREYIVSKQLLRSGTSIGANINEASAAESTKDFIYKMSIASKEARESLNWLNLLEESELTSIDVNSHIDSCMELIKILTSIVKTTKLKLSEL